jgi:hypothetical protein
MVEGGLGVRAYDHPRGTAYGHGGTMAGYTAQLRATRDGEHIVIAAANSHSIPVMRAIAATVRELCASVPGMTLRHDGDICALL